MPNLFLIGPYNRNYYLLTKIHALFFLNTQLDHIS